MQSTCLRWLLLSFILLVGCGGRSLAPPIDARPDDARSGQESFSSPQGKIVQTARNLLGTPYRFGGMTPKGFDCSGYVAYVFKQSVGKNLPRRTTEQIKFGKAISPRKLGPGDLLYFWIEEQGIFHVGIYIGKDQFIHAPSRDGEVNIQRLHDPYWNERYRGARRIV
jgi:cell wall-associated NlpC family hydrolase